MFCELFINVVCFKIQKYTRVYTVYTDNTHEHVIFIRYTKMWHVQSLKHKYRSVIVFFILLRMMLL